MLPLRLIWAVVHALFTKRANLVAENLALRAGSAFSAIECVQRLGGMLRFYHRAAA